MSLSHVFVFFVSLADMFQYCFNAVSLAIGLLFAADDGKLGTKLYHAVNLVILTGVPAVIATSPSALTMPLDVVLGLALPLHAHIGMNYGDILNFLLYLLLWSDLDKILLFDRPE